MWVTSVMGGLLCAAVPGAGAGSAGLAAQDPDSAQIRPVPPDTLPRPLAQDTLAQDTTAQDSVVPPPQLVTLDAPGSAGWSAGVWEWDREALLRLPDLTLVHLLARLPGLLPVRTALVGQAEANTVFGSAAGGVRYVVNGYEMDPLVEPTFDPSRLPLLALERVRVERRVTGATVRIETMTPEHGQPTSVIEAGTGDLDTNMFRGMFLTPNVLGGPLAAGFERLASESVANGGSNQTAGWLKYTFVRDSTGIQLEFRQASGNRDGVGDPFTGERRDWAVRARTRYGVVAAEAYAGASYLEDDPGELDIREGSPQAGVRLASRFGPRIPLDVLAAFRVRSHPRLPGQQLDVQAWLEPAPWVAVGGEVVQGWWDGPTRTGRWSATARMGPLLGLSAFATIDRAGALFGEGDADLLVEGTVGTPGFASSRDGERVGAEWTGFGFHLGAAAIRSTADSAAAFGLAFDRAATRVAAGEATGYEVTARIPTGFDPLWLEGWFVELNAEPGWLYLPQHQWRAGLVYQHVPLPSGNLEIYLRGEHQFRSGMAVPDQVGGVTAVGPLRTTNAELTIRVVTVRAFIRWENVRNRQLQQDIPGYSLRGQNILYGVKWEFRN